MNIKDLIDLLELSGNFWDDYHKKFNELISKMEKFDNIADVKKLVRKIVKLYSDSYNDLHWMLLLLISDVRIMQLGKEQIFDYIMTLNNLDEMIKYNICANVVEDDKAFKARDILSKSEYEDFIIKMHKKMKKRIKKVTDKYGIDVNNMTDEDINIMFGEIDKKFFLPNLMEYDPYDPPPQLRYFPKNLGEHVFKWYACLSKNNFDSVVHSFFEKFYKISKRERKFILSGFLDAVEMNYKELDESAILKVLNEGKKSMLKGIREKTYKLGAELYGKPFLEEELKRSRSKFVKSYVDDLIKNVPDNFQKKIKPSVNSMILKELGEKLNKKYEEINIDNNFPSTTATIMAALAIPDVISFNEILDSVFLGEQPNFKSKEDIESFMNIFMEIWNKLIYVVNVKDLDFLNSNNKKEDYLEERIYEIIDYIEDWEYFSESYEDIIDEFDLRSTFETIKVKFENLCLISNKKDWIEKTDKLDLELAVKSIWEGILFLKEESRDVVSILIEENKKKEPENVLRFEQRRIEKIGRNEPCPCGSGKKYKHCCMKND